RVGSGIPLARRRRGPPARPRPQFLLPPASPGKKAMTLHALRDRPSSELARALAEFDSRFSYPLGPGRSFRISHGEDYPRFFRAMGEAACFVAERQGEVLGTIGCALRRVLSPDGRERDAVYVGDLKVAPPARGGRVLVRLAQ